MSGQELAVRSEQALQAPRHMDLAEVMQYAEVFCKSGFFEDAKQLNQAAVKILAGQELGIAPFAAMNGIYIIKGRVSFAAGLMAMIVKGSIKYDYRVVEQTNTVCRIMFFELNRATGSYETLGESIFTYEDGIRQGTQNLQKFPVNMLFARAMSNGCRFHTPDIFGGPVYTPDELGATIIEETGEIILPPEKPKISARPSAQPAAQTIPEPSPQSPPPFDPRDSKEAMDGFTAKARDVYGYEGKIGELAIALLGEKPMKWDRAAWLECYDKPDGHWYAVIEALTGDTYANDESAALPTEQAPAADESEPVA